MLKDYGRRTTLKSVGRRLTGHQSTQISLVAIDGVQGYFCS